MQILTPAILPIGDRRWEYQYTIDHSIWPSIFTALFKVYRAICLQSFQYRILHRIRPCNAWLYVREAVKPNHCQYIYCTNNNLDVINHYLVTCLPVGRYRESFVTWRN